MKKRRKKPKKQRRYPGERKRLNKKCPLNPPPLPEILVPEEKC